MAPPESTGKKKGKKLSKKEQERLRLEAERGLLNTNHPIALFLISTNIFVTFNICYYAAAAEAEEKRRQEGTLYAISFSIFLSSFHIIFSFLLSVHHLRRRT